MPQTHVLGLGYGYGPSVKVVFVVVFTTATMAGLYLDK